MTVLTALVLASCSSAETEAQSDNSTATTLVDELQEEETPLPVLHVQLDEIGPGDLEGMVDEAQFIFEASIVRVEPGIRYYGPTEEMPDTSAFEQVGLVFQPTDVLKGEVADEITIRWTAYQTDGDKPGAERLARVSLNGLQLNEDAKGQRFGIFVGPEVGDGVYESLSTLGVVPLDSEGNITNKEGFTNEVLYGEFIDKPFGDLVTSVDGAE